MLHRAVIFRTGEQGQGALHRFPAIGVETLPTGKRAGVIDVTQADIVSGQRKPEPVWSVDAVGQAFVKALQIAGTAINALGGVQPVFDTNFAGRWPCQHH